MSDNDSDTQILTAEYRDGQLQIVGTINREGTTEDLSADTPRYIQVLDPDKGLINLDSLNLTLVRCEGSEGDSSYRLVTNAECERDGDASVSCMLQDDDDLSYVVVEGNQDDLIILENAADHTEDNDQMDSRHHSVPHTDQQTYIDIQTDGRHQSVPHNDQQMYIDIKMDGGHQSVPHNDQQMYIDIKTEGRHQSLQNNDQQMYIDIKTEGRHQSLQNNDQQMYIDIEIPHDDDDSGGDNGNTNGNVVQVDQTEQQENDSTATKVTPDVLIQRAKIVQQRLLGRQKRALASIRPPQRRHIKSPQEMMMQSPVFKLFLYSCKLCSYKCNAQKDLTNHRNTEHMSKARVNNKAMGAFQCVKCPFRAGLKQQLIAHVEEKHNKNRKLNTGKMLTLESREVFEADVLVCGACGFECSQRDAFREHITQHYTAS